MLRLRLLALLMMFGLLCPAMAFQDKDGKDKDKDKKDKKEEKKIKGFLPPNFKKLGLSDAHPAFFASLLLSSAI